MAVLVITTLALPPVIVAGVYNQTVAASGGTAPYTWSIISGGNLPSWLSLNAGTGALTGTSVSAGNYTFQIQATDSVGATALQSLTVVSGYTTIADIASFVSTEYLKRSDIDTECKSAAMKIYRIICAKVPFDQLVQLTGELPLVKGQDSYDLSTMTPPLLGIIDIRMTINSTTRRRLRRSSGRLYDSLSIINNGQPATYARTAGQQIQLNPPPDSNAYTLRLRYWTRPTEHPTVPASTVLATPLEWDALFNWETAWWVLNDLGQEDRAMRLVQPMMMPRQQAPKKTPSLEMGIIPRLWNELLTTTSQKENVDEDFGVNPVMRAYSYRR